MKKTMIVLSAVLALVACNKVTPDTENNGTIDASKLVFDITITNADATKAVKDGWKTGDKVYLFFEDNTSAYVTMEYGAGAWGDPTATGTLSLSATGKKVTAVYVPFNTDAPSYSGGWQFTKKNAYYMSAEGKEYTVTTDPSTDLSTLSATLEMNNNAGFVQILLADDSPVEGKYVMYAAGLIPTWCGTIVPGGSVTPGTATAGLPIEPMVVAGEGYYFYGTVSSSLSEPTFYIVEQDPTNKYAIGTHVKSMSGTGKSLAAKAAVKFTSLPAQEPWVDLGLASGLKWATGNLSNSGIVAPTEYGQYYAWGETTGYDYDTTHKFDGSEYEFNANPGTTYPDSFTKYNSTSATLETSDDAAYVITSGEYRMPTTTEIQAMHTACGDGEWVTISGVAGRKFTGPNGLVVFFPAAGIIVVSGAYLRGHGGLFWSSSQYDDNSDDAYFLFFSSGRVSSLGNYYRCYGLSVRPVQD